MSDYKFFGSIFCKIKFAASSFTGTIDNANVNDTTVTWTVSPAISKQKAQVPSRRVSSDLMGRFIET